MQETNGVGESKYAADDLLLAELVNDRTERPHALGDQYAFAVHCVVHLAFFRVEVFDDVRMSERLEHLESE